MVAMGVIGEKEQMGNECSGVARRTGSDIHSIHPGDMILTMGVDCMRTSTVTVLEKVWKLPESLSLEEAATIPIVFATTIYSLVHIH